jgi:hypothetical protein
MWGYGSCPRGDLNQLPTQTVFAPTSRLAAGGEDAYLACGGEKLTFVRAVLSRTCSLTRWQTALLSAAVTAVRCRDRGPGGWLGPGPR